MFPAVCTLYGLGIQTFVSVYYDAKGSRAAKVCGVCRVRQCGILTGSVVY
jgi:hypothetical protein